MSSNRIMTIGKTPVQVTDTELNQAELLFFKENPRVFTALHSTENADPSQSEIEKIMCTREHVKTLKTSIKANAGLLNPIIVKDNVVLEGNSRLAAYRLLAKEEPGMWDKIKCTVLPPDISQELIFNLLGTIHIIGQTPWSAFEQAGYLYRTKQKSRRPIEAIAADLGMKVPEAKLLMKVYETMLQNEDVRPSKWSYYYELFKNNAIKKADDEYPEHNIIDTIVEKIKNDEIYEAKDIRKIADIIKSKNEDALEVFCEYVEGEIELDDAVELVSDVNKTQKIKNEFKKFEKLMMDELKIIGQMTKIDSDFNLQIAQIHNTLGQFLKVK